MARILLLTESRYEKPKKKTPYIQNILTEDGLVRSALERRGFRVERRDWAATDLEVGAYDLLLFRTTWDYFDRFREFSEWLDRVEQQGRFLNPLPQVRWNLDKHYLRELEEQDVPIPPTVFVEKGTSTSLRTLHRQTGWTRSVLKPTISGAARHTYLLSPEKWEAHEPIFQQLVAEESMLLQEFQHRIFAQGEVAFMLFGGRFTHAVLKRAKPGDFRVQDDFGGTVHDYQPDEEEIAFAERVIERIQPTPAYARVDGIWDNSGRLVVSEVELIEPELWFRNHPPAADRLAEEVVKALG